MRRVQDSGKKNQEKARVHLRHLVGIAVVLAMLAPLLTVAVPLADAAAGDGIADPGEIGLVTALEPADEYFGLPVEITIDGTAHTCWCMNKDEEVPSTDEFFGIRYEVLDFATIDDSFFGDGSGTGSNIKNDVATVLDAVSELGELGIRDIQSAVWNVTDNAGRSTDSYDRFQAGEYTQQEVVFLEASDAFDLGFQNLGCLIPGGGPVTNDPTYDLATTIEFSGGAPTTPVNAGDDVTYSVVVKNQGEADSGAFTFVVTLPTGTSHVSNTMASQIPGATVAVAGDGSSLTVTVDAADQLAPNGAMVMFDVVANVDNPARTLYRADVEITADSGDDKDSDPASADTGGTDWAQDSVVTNHNDATTDVDGTGDAFDDHDAEEFANTPIFDLATTIEFTSGSAPTTPLSLGDQISYLIEVQNQGTTTGAEYGIVVTLPTGTSYVSNTSGLSVTNNGDGTVSLLGISSPPGLLESFNLIVNVDDATQPLYRADVEVTASNPDVDSTPGSGDSNNATTSWSQTSPATNHNDVSTNVDGPGDAFDDHDAEEFTNEVTYDLATTIEFAAGTAPTAVAAGTDVVYTVEVRNQGAVASGAYTFEIALPAGMSFVSDTGAPVAGVVVGGAGGTVTYAVGAANEMAAGETVSFPLTLNVDDPSLTLYRADVEITADSGEDKDSDPTSVDNNAADTTWAQDSATTNHNDVTTDVDGPGDAFDDHDAEEFANTPIFDLATTIEFTSGTAPPTPLSVGDQVSYLIEVQNQGTTTGAEYGIVVTLPTGTSYVSNTSGLSVTNNGDGTVSLLGISSPPGLLASFNLIVNVDDATRPLYRADVEVAASNPDVDSTPNSGDSNNPATTWSQDSAATNHNAVITDVDGPGDAFDDHDAEEFTNDPIYDLATTIEFQSGTAPAASVTVGQQVVYTVEIRNQGVISSGAYTFQVALPTGMSYVSDTTLNSAVDSATNPGFVSFTPADSLASGQVQSFALTLQVDDNLQPLYRADVEITSDSGEDKDSDPTSVDNNAVDTAWAQDSATTNHNDVTTDVDGPGDAFDDHDAEEFVNELVYDLATTIEFATSAPTTPVTVGQQVAYAVEVRNQGTTDSGEITFVVALPTGMSYVSDDSGLIPTDSGTLLTYAVPAGSTIAPLTSLPFTLTLQVDDDSQTLYRADVEITVDDGDDKDSDPTTNDTGSVATSWAQTSASTNHNDAMTDVDGPGDAFDDHDAEEFTNDPIYDLATTIEFATGVAPATPLAPDADVVYTVELKNQGVTASGAYTFEIELPAGTSYVSGGPTPAISNGGQTLTYVVDAANELVPNAIQSFDITVNVDDPSLALYRADIEITADSGDDVDSDPTSGDNNAVATAWAQDSSLTNHNDVNTNVDGPDDAFDDHDAEEFVNDTFYDLATTIEFATGTPPTTPVRPGDQVVYLVEVRNQGTLPSGEFSFEVALPAGTSYVSDTSGVTVDSGTPGVVTFLVDAPAAQLAPSTDLSFALTVTVDDSTQTLYRADVEITGDDGNDKDSDPTSADNGAAATTWSQDSAATNHNAVTTDVDGPGDAFDDHDAEEFMNVPVYDLATTIEFQTAPSDPTTVAVGDQIIYIVEVRNQGTVDSGPITFEVALPTGMTYVSDTSGVTVTNNGATVTFEVDAADELAPDTTLSFPLTLEVADDDQTLYRADVEITADDGDDKDSDPTSADNRNPATTWEQTSPATNHNDVTTDIDGPGDAFDDHDAEEFVNTPPDPIYDLAVTIEFASGTAPVARLAPGQQVTYLVEVRNQGEVDSGDYTFVVDLPADTTLVSQTSGLEVDTTTPGVVAFNGALTDGGIATELLVGDTLSFDLVLAVTTATETAYRADVEITTDSGDDKDSDPTSADNGDPATTWEQTSPITNHNDVTTDIDGPGDAFDDHDAEEFTNEPVYDLATTIEFASGVAPSSPVSIGDQVTYTVEVRNQGSIASLAYSFEVSVPTGMTYVSDTSGVAVTDNGTTITFEVTNPAGGLDPGETLSFPLVLEIADDSQLLYRADVEITVDSDDDKDSDPTSADNGDPATTWAQDDAATNHNDVTTDIDGPGDAFDDHDAEEFVNEPIYDLAVTIEFASGTAPGPQVATNDQVTYLVEIRNQGRIASGAYAVEVAVPDGMSAVSETSGLTFTNNSTTLLFEADLANELAVDETISFNLVLNIDENDRTLYRADVEITADSGDDIDSDPTSTDNNDVATTWAQDSATTNHNDVTTNVDGPGDAFDDHDAEEFVNDPVYDLATTIEFATSAPATPVSVGDQVVYTLEVRNQGTVDSGTFSYVVAVPEGMSYVSGSSTGVTVTDGGTTVTFVVPELSELTPGTTLSFPLTLSVDDPAQTNYRADVEIIADSGDDKDSDPTSGDNQNVSTTWAQDSTATNHNDVLTDVDGPGDTFDDHDAEEFENDPIYDLATTIAFASGVAPGSPVMIDDDIIYTVEVRNQGIRTSGAYTFEVALPTGMSYVSDTSGVTVTNNGTTVTFAVDAANELASGATLSFPLALNVDDAGQTLYRADVEITVDSGDDIDSDPTSADNNDADTAWAQDSVATNHNDVATNVDGPGDAFDDHDAEEFVNEPVYDLATTIEFASGVAPASPVSIADEVTYTVEVRNQGTVPSGDFSFEVALPFGMSYVSDESGQTVDTTTAGQVTFTSVAELAPSETLSFALTLQIDNDSQSLYRADVEITRDDGDDKDSAPGSDNGNPQTNWAQSSVATNHNAVVTDVDGPFNAYDDHDAEEFVNEPVYDLAVTIEFASGVAPGPSIAVNEQVTYLVELRNQGRLDSGAYAFVVELPEGMSYVSNTTNPAEVALTADVVGGIATLTFEVDAANQLLIEEQISFEVVAQADDNSLLLYRADVEITADSDDDIDSDPTSTDNGDAATAWAQDSVATNHNDVTTDVDGPGDAFDDHDAEEFVNEAVYDLATTIEFGSPPPSSPVNPGDQIVYTVEVRNQGTVPSDGYSFVVQLPAGTSFVSDTSGLVPTSAPGTLTYVVPAVNELAPAETLSFELTANIDGDSELLYRADVEIIADSVALTDKDSDPTSNDNANPATTWTQASTSTNHNEVLTDVDGPGDAFDDHDAEEFVNVPIYDLAVTIEFASGAAPVSPAAIGDEVTYLVELRNQGRIESGAYSFEVAVPEGMTYVSNTTDPAVVTTTPSGDGTTIAFAVEAANELGVAEQLSFDLVLEIADETVLLYRADVEITADSDDDIDSDPASADNNDPATTWAQSETTPDGTNHNDVRTDVDGPGDAFDDHDAEEFVNTPIYDLSTTIEFELGTPPVSPLSVGDTVSYIVEVQNQGRSVSGEYAFEVTLPVGMGYMGDDSTDLVVTPSETVVRYDAVGASELGLDETESFVMMLKVLDASLLLYRADIEIIADSGDDIDSDPTSSDSLAATTAWLQSETTPDGSNHNDVSTDVDGPGDAFDDHDAEEFVHVPLYDLSTIIAFGADIPAAPVNEGDVVDFVVEIMNQGRSVSGAFDFEVTLPIGTSFVSENSGLDPVQTGNVLTFSVPTNEQLEQTEVLTVNVRVQIEDPELMMYRADVEITVDSGDDKDSDPTSADAGGTDWAQDSTSTNRNDVAEDVDGIGDAFDDHDAEELSNVPVYDLATTIEFSTAAPTEAVVPGDEVTYLVEIRNQGTIHSGAYAFEVSVPMGMEYVSDTSTDLTVTNNGTTVVFEASDGQQLLRATQLGFEMVLAVVDSSKELYRADVEITADSGDDKDSDPTSGDAGTTDWAQVDPATNHNDVATDVDGEGDVWDDHDAEEFANDPRLDLALRLQFDDGTNARRVSIGDELTMVVTVYNQGSVPVKDVGLVQFLPEGLELSDDVWTVVDGKPTITLASVLAPGASTQVEITVAVKSASASPTSAEITGAVVVDANGDPVATDLVDRDSTPDAIDDETPVDDEIDNTSGDEDDHDTVALTLFVPTSTLLPSPGSFTPTTAGEPSPVAVTPAQEVPGTLALTGTNARLLSLLGVLLTVSGACLVMASKPVRRRRPR